MPLNYKPCVVKEKLDEFLNEVNTLLDLSYKEGEERKRDLDVRVKNFVPKAFEDGKEKINSYFGSVFAIGGDKTSREKQKEYERDLKRRKRNLKAWLEEVELIENLSRDEKKIDKAEKKIVKINKETERRKAVVNQKVAGAQIEFIDKLRDELKERESIKKDLIEIKKDIKEIKDAISRIGKEE